MKAGAKCGWALLPYWRPPITRDPAAQSCRNESRNARNVEEKTCHCMIDRCSLEASVVAVVEWMSCLECYQTPVISTSILCELIATTMPQRYAALSARGAVA